MTRRLVSIGVALIDAGVRPAVASWVVSLLQATGRAYLPHPEVEIDERRTVLRFEVDDRALVLAIARPGRAAWCRKHPDGTQDRAMVGFAPVPCVQRLFEWLLDDTAIPV